MGTNVSTEPTVVATAMGGRAHHAAADGAGFLPMLNDFLRRSG